MKRIITSFILGSIGVIFLSDLFFYTIGHDTISQEITAWIDQGVSHLVIFIGIVLLISLHFIYGKYENTN